MIPYKFFDLTARDQTGVLLSNIQRYSTLSVALADVEVSIFTVPPENGFLLTSFSVEGEGSIANPFLAGGLYCLDAQGNPITQLFQRSTAVNSATATQNAEYGAITVSGSPIMVIGPGIEIILSAKFQLGLLANTAFFGLNGVLIPRGTMAFQS